VRALASAVVAVSGDLLAAFLRDEKRDVFA